eukprot:scaffold95413_cov63-Phaeocystis_antarctica.AAC.6
MEIPNSLHGFPNSWAAVQDESHLQARHAPPCRAARSRPRYTRAGDRGLARRRLERPARGRGAGRHDRLRCIGAAAATHRTPRRHTRRKLTPPPPPADRGALERGASPAAPPAFP